MLLSDFEEDGFPLPLQPDIEPELARPGLLGVSSSPRAKTDTSMCGACQPPSGAGSTPGLSVLNP
jgi:hypothetical protein